MEKKNGPVIALAIVSLSLIVMLAYSNWQTKQEVGELRSVLSQMQVSKAKRSDSAPVITPEDTYQELDAGAVSQSSEAKETHVFGQPGKETDDGKHVHESNPRSTSHMDQSVVQLLNAALAEIVEHQLEAHLACDYNTSSTECTIQPGPKGDQGDIGPRGPKGDQGKRGEPGARGDQGEKGDRGDPGEKGDQGDTGLQGPEGAMGPRGPAGPTPTLSQSSCTWQYTDTCGHSCGVQTFRTTCPLGQYVAGFGISTWHASGRYNTHILCCSVA